MSPNRGEIDRLLRGGATLDDVRRRLAELGDPIGRNSLQKHRASHLSVAVGPGRRPVVALRQAVISQVEQKLADGELAATVRDALTAQRDLDNLAEKGADRDLMLKMAMILGGAMPVPQLREPATEGEWEMAEEAAEDDALFARLGASTARETVYAPTRQQRDGGRRVPQ